MKLRLCPSCGVRPSISVWKYGRWTGVVCCDNHNCDLFIKTKRCSQEISKKKIKKRLKKTWNKALEDKDV